MNLPINVSLEMQNGMRQYELEVTGNQQIQLCSATPIIPGQTRIYYDTTENWNSQPTLLSKRGVIYVYSDAGSLNESDVPAIKIGDGTSYLIDMPFVGEDAAMDLYEHIQDSGIHVTSAQKVFWNNKSSAFTDPEDAENLILSNTQYMLNGGIYNG